MQVNVIVYTYLCIFIIIHLSIFILTNANVRLLSMRKRALYATTFFYVNALILRAAIKEIRPRLLSVGKARIKN